MSESMNAIFEQRDDDLIPIQIGPSHPAVHGTLPIYARLDGEIMAEVDVEIGYLHRGIEKLAESLTYHQFIPLTDRFNYVSTMLCNEAYCEAVEKLLGIASPPRAVFLRVIMAEVSRIMDHITAIGPNFVDMGALTIFWYTFKVREELYRAVEMLTGARMTTCFTRVGGVVRDTPDGFIKELRAALDQVPPMAEELLKLIKKNRIVLDRTMGVGQISAEDAIDYGFAGPCLRACGVPRDLRVDEPYACYDQVEFDVVVGTAGDAFDRIMVRCEEMLQSHKIIMQLLEKLPDGPVVIDDPRIILPPKQQVYNSIEGLIHHFNLVMDGFADIPAGEIYHAVEGANGEFGFYIVSRGEKSPWRMHLRAPCFAIYQAFPQMVKGQMLADAIITLGSLNIVAGELDR